VYLKGVHIRLVEPEIVEVSELTVDHPGTQFAGAGLSKGWYYAIQPTGLWSRHKHADECPCNNELRHLHHMWTVGHFDALLADGRFRQLAELDYSPPELIV